MDRNEQVSVCIDGTWLSSSHSLHNTMHALLLQYMDEPPHRSAESALH